MCGLSPDFSLGSPKLLHYNYLTKIDEYAKIAAMLKEITDSDFVLEVEQHNGVVLVDFWAPWCGPCVMMAPIYEKMSKRYSNLKFCKINTEEHMEHASRYNVTGIPCIIVFKNGKEIERLVGFRPEKAFEEALSKYTQA